MGHKQEQTKTQKDTQGKKSVNISVTFDKSIWEIISSSQELGESDSGKVNHICVSWLSEHGILSGIIKKRLDIR
jgi:hypothetical protein